VLHAIAYIEATAEIVRDDWALDGSILELALRIAAQCPPPQDESQRFVTIRVLTTMEEF
jgi:hypothetical protein